MLNYVTELECHREDEGLYNICCLSWNIHLNLGLQEAETILDKANEDIYNIHFILIFISFISRIVSCCPLPYNTHILCRPLPLMKAAVSCWNVRWIKTFGWWLLWRNPKWDDRQASLTHKVCRHENFSDHSMLSHTLCEDIAFYIPFILCPLSGWTFGATYKKQTNVMVIPSGCTSTVLSADAPLIKPHHRHCIYKACTWEDFIVQHVNQATGHD